MVPKKDGSWRSCGDYRRLNKATVHNRYLIPNIQDFTSHLHGCTVFSKINLVKGYHQVPVSPEDIYMPFGLKNAAQTFQRLMDKILCGLPYVFVYLDEILIASRNMEEPHQHLKQVLSILQKNGLIINPEKCTFAQPKLEFLGHHVCGTGLAPLDKHVAAVQAFPPPSDIKQLQRFSGFLNFYRIFLPGIAGILRPLTDGLRSSSNREFTWTEEQQAAFEVAKSAMINAVKLSHPVPAAELALATDVSDYHVGGVLQRREGTEW
jgi:hypothetical protein